MKKFLLFLSLFIFISLGFAVEKASGLAHQDYFYETYFKETIQPIADITVPYIEKLSETSIIDVLKSDPTPIMVHPEDETICNNSSTNIPLISSNTVETVLYTWEVAASSANITGFRSQVTAIAGPIAQTLTNSGISVETVAYTITPVIGDCRGMPVTVVVTVLPVPIMTDPGILTICSTETTNIPLESNNTGATVLYTWIVAASSANITGFSSQATAIAGPIAQTLTNSGISVETVAYTITPVIGDCRGMPVTVVVTVLPVPIMTDPGILTICSTETTNIPLESNNTGATVLYTWIVAASSANITGFSSQATAIAGPIAQTLTNIGLSVETVTYIITPVIGDCRGMPVIVIVTVNPEPVIIDPGTLTICSTETTNIPLESNNTGATVLYTWIVAASSANITGFSSQATAIAGPIAQTLTNSGLSVETVTYIITPVIGDCRGMPVIVIVTVNPEPVMTDPSNSTYCSTSSINIPLESVNYGATVLYTWTAVGSSANITGFSSQATAIAGPIAQTLTNIGLSVETVTYTITPVIGDCRGMPVIVIVTVNPEPVMTDPSNSTYCSTSSINIPLESVNYGATVLYTWTAVGSSANITGFSSQATAIAGPIAQTLTNSGPSIETVTYWITPDISYCMGNPVVVVVTVLPTPIIDKTGKVVPNTGIKTYPNPSTGIIKIEGLPVNQKNKIALYTLDGKLIKEFTSSSSSVTINISDQTLGTYLLRINKLTYKILKE